MRLITLLTTIGLIGVALAQDALPKVDGPLSVADAIKLAQEYSPSLVAARSQVLAASARTRSARSALSPQLSANSFATTGSYDAIVSSSPGVMPTFWLMSPSGGFIDQNLMLMVPLFTGGKLQATVAAAGWQQRAALGELAEIMAELSLRVRDAYLSALLAKRMVSVQEAKVSYARELLRTTQAQFEAGKEIEASVQRVQAELARSMRALTSAQNDVSKALLALDAAMGIDFASTISLTDELSIQPTPGTLEGFIKSAKASRGSILAARARLESAGADIRAAEAQRSPQLYGQAMGDWASRRMGTGFTFALTLSVPIIDGGRIAAEVAGAKAQKLRALADFTEALLSIERDVRGAWLDLETAKSNTVSAEASVTAAQAAYEVISVRVGAGKAILVEQLSALQSLTQARADFAQAMYDHNIALARLLRSAGVAK